MEGACHPRQNGTPSALMGEGKGASPEIDKQQQQQQQQQPESQGEREQLNFDAVFRAVVCTADTSGTIDASSSLAQLLERLAEPVPLMHPDSDVKGCDNCTLDVETLIRKAVEEVLARYSELVVTPDMERGTTTSPSSPALSLQHVSLANLRSLSTLLSHRPHFSSPVLASLFQFTVVVVKHAPLQALDDEGCHVLVSLLELLGCLPRGPAAGGMPGILRVARITARNVMRRVGPRLFQKTAPVGPQPGIDTSGVMVPKVQEEVDRSLIPWVERQLLPLHVVSGEEARADLKEDRRLALLVLGFMLNDNPERVEPSRRIALHYLANAVASVLDAENGGADGHEREQALSFLERVDLVLSSTPATARKSDVRHLCFQPSVPEQAVQGFLLAKDAAYLREFAKLRQYIEEERCKQVLLRRQMEELSQEREGILSELQQNLVQSLPPSEMANSLPSSVGVKGDAGEGTLEEVDSLAETWAHNMVNLLQPVEELAVAMHKKEQKRRAPSTETEYPRSCTQRDRCNSQTDVG